MRAFIVHVIVEFSLLEVVPRVKEEPHLYFSHQARFRILIVNLLFTKRQVHFKVPCCYFKRLVVEKSTEAISLFGLWINLTIVLKFEFVILLFIKKLDTANVPIVYLALL